MQQQVRISLLLTKTGILHLRSTGQLPKRGRAYYHHTTLTSQRTRREGKVGSRRLAVPALRKPSQLRRPARPRRPWDHVISPSTYGRDAMATWRQSGIEGEARRRTLRFTEASVDFRRWTHRPSGCRSSFGSSRLGSVGDSTCERPPVPNGQRASRSDGAARYRSLSPAACLLAKPLANWDSVKLEVGWPPEQAPQRQRTRPEAQQTPQSQPGRRGSREIAVRLEPHAIGGMIPYYSLLKHGGCILRGRPRSVSS